MIKKLMKKVRLIREILGAAKSRENARNKYDMRN